MINKFSSLSLHIHSISLISKHQFSMHRDILWKCQWDTQVLRGKDTLTEIFLLHYFSYNYSLTHIYPFHRDNFFR